MLGAELGPQPLGVLSDAIFDWPVTKFELGQHYIIPQKERFLGTGVV